MKHKLKVVFDTNIYISGIIFGGTPLLCIDYARERKVDLYISKKIILELAVKLREKFEWEDGKVSSVVHGVLTFARLVEPKVTVDIIKKDPADNRILEVAKEVDADYIISGDKRHILPLKKLGKTKIVTAAEFIKLVDIEN